MSITSHGARLRWHRLALIAGWGFFAMPTQADEPDMKVLILELKSHMKQLTDRVSVLEQALEQERSKREKAEAEMARVTSQPVKVDETEPARVTTGESDRIGMSEAGVPAAAQPVVMGDAKGTFKFPGTDTSLGFGGYVKLDTIYNSVSARSNRFSDQLYFPGLVPLKGEGQRNKLAFSPRETRLWFKSLTPTKWGDLNTYVELDFYAFQSPGNQVVSNSYAPRMRHAFGTLGPFLAGQTWSTFMHVGALPELLDFGAPAGRVFIRQPLLRWTQPVALGDMEADIQLALEQPESVLTAPDGETLEMDNDRVPDTVVRLNLNPAWGALSLAGMMRQIRYTDHTASSQAWGGALSISGKVRTFGFDHFSFQASYGNALGRYTSFSAFNDGLVDAQGSVRLVNLFAGFAAYQHWWSPTWRSSVAYGYAFADNPSFAPDTANDWVQSAHVNLLWSPFIQTTFGLEYMYATRRVFNGAQGDLQRVMFSSRLNF
ncbi:DcaP family trimeric outer membrane transporter [Nitrosomonas sp. ANs5]|uniref:DcaP family trimeric outer membrane transporter n=1 Tax=Nitrosomonas sp. ANs5 TaxID=3423941 RepID=UPI003D34CDA7